MKSEYDFSKMKKRKNPYIKQLRKYFNIAYIMPILVIIIFLVGALSGCDNPLVPKPDIRKEHTEADKPDFYGWKWNFKW